MHATTWVFLRGLARQHRHWEDFPEQFRAAFPDSTVLLLDTPGNGDLCHRPSPTSISGMVASLRKQLAAHHVQRPVNLLAISMGAMIAIEWMEQHPEEIERAVLINTSLRSMSPFSDRLRKETWPTILKDLLLERDPLIREQHVLAMSCNLLANRDALARKWAEYDRQHPTSRVNAVRQLVAGGLYHAPAARPHEHVLLLQSLGDKLVNPVCTTRMAERWRWPLMTHPTAGHDLTLDDGDWVIGCLRKWMQEHPLPPSSA